MKAIVFLCAAGLLAMLTGCAVTPETIVQGPTSARPQLHAQGAARPANGAIFQTTAYRPMFEDRRARYVGDILTMTIVEKTAANKAGANSTSKTGSAEAGITSLFAIPAATLGKLGVGTSSANKLEENGATSSSNTFTGTVGVTVIDVLANGNLVVSGEKQVAFDKGTEFIRFSGIVNPDHITTGNNIISTQVADARIEYRTSSHLDATEVMGIMTRFFLSIIPL